MSSAITGMWAAGGSTKRDSIGRRRAGRPRRSGQTFKGPACLNSLASLRRLLGSDAFGTFICNPDAEDYGLTSDYNEAMNGCLRHLADWSIDDGCRIKAIDSIDPSVMTLLAHRYDDVRMTYSNANRKVVSKFLHAAINTQLLAQRIRSALPAIGRVEPHVKGEPVDPVLFGWPTCLKLAKALHEYAAMEERPDWSQDQEGGEVDADVAAWMKVAEDESYNAMRGDTVDEAEIILEAVDKGDENSDEEFDRVEIAMSQDIGHTAEQHGLSIEPDDDDKNKWLLLGDDTQDFGWDPTNLPPGVHRAAPEGQSIIIAEGDPFDQETVASLELVSEVDESEAAGMSSMITAESATFESVIELGHGGVDRREDRHGSRAA